MFRIHPGVATYAIAAVSITALGITSANASVTHHPEPAVCGPIVALVEYWLPITDHATPRAIPDPPPAGQVRPPRYPWADAATEIYSIAQFAPAALSLDADSAANSIGALGEAFPASDWRPVLRHALAGIRSSCPSLPASVVNGPLPK